MEQLHRAGRTTLAVGVGKQAWMNGIQKGPTCAELDKFVTDLPYWDGA